MQTTTDLAPKTRVRIVQGTHKGKRGVIGDARGTGRNAGKVEVAQVGHKNESYWVVPTWVEVEGFDQPKPENIPVNEGDCIPAPWQIATDFAITLLSGQNVEVRFVPGSEGERRMHQFNLTGPVSPTGFRSHFVLATEAETMATPCEYGTQFARLVAAEFASLQQALEQKRVKKGDSRSPKKAAPPPATIVGDSPDEPAFPSHVESSATSDLSQIPSDHALESYLDVSESVEAATEPEAHAEALPLGIAQVQADLTQLTGHVIEEAIAAFPHYLPDDSIDSASGSVELVVIQPTFFDYNSLDVETRIVVIQRTQQIKERIRRTAQNILEIGQKLIEVKGWLGHGNFKDWAKAEFDWDIRTAQRFMSVAVAFKSDNLSFFNFAPSALYLLAAPSTPAEVRQKVLDRAKVGEVITYAKAKKAVAGAKTTFQEDSSVHADYCQAGILRLGDWVVVRSLQGDQICNGLRGPVVELEDNDGRFGVDLSQASGESEWKCLRFSLQELIKVPAPPPYKVSEILMIQCDVGATPEQRQHDGCWGIVQEVLEFTVIVAVNGELVQYSPKDLDWVDNPDSTLRDVCDRVTRLWSVPNLPKSVQHLLRTFYQRQLIFPQGDLDVLQAIEDLYQGQDLRG